MHATVHVVPIKLYVADNFENRWPLYRSGRSTNFSDLDLRQELEETDIKLTVGHLAKKKKLHFESKWLVNYLQ